jgi:hypothetical protein
MEGWRQGAAWLKQELTGWKRKRKHPYRKEEKKNILTRKKKKNILDTHRPSHRRLCALLPWAIVGGKLIYHQELAGDFITKRFRIDEDLSHLDHAFSEMPMYQSLA